MIYPSGNYLGVVQLTFRNNCYGKKCCTPVDDSATLDRLYFSDGRRMCTPYTTGMMRTRETYGYGSYRWISMATRDFSHTRKLIKGVADADEETDVFSCFTIENDEEAPVLVSISLCVSMRDPDVASTSLTIGNASNVLNVYLPFYANETMARYEIEYTKEKISWLADGIILREVHSDEVENYPDEEMKIEMGLFPMEVRNTTEDEVEASDRSYLEVRMRVFRVRFLEQKKWIVHDEPMLLDEPSSASTWKIIGAIGLAFVIILCVVTTMRLFYVLSKTEDVDPKAVYLLGEENTKCLVANNEIMKSDNNLIPQFPMKVQS